MPTTRSAPAPAGFTDCACALWREPARRRFTRKPRLTIYLSTSRRSGIDSAETHMRAEAEALTQAIKQSMGLLRRHL
jgi:hypothetical protein